MSPKKTTQPHILMCPPEYYGIEYEINPWMSRSRASDTEVARQQWESLRALLGRVRGQGSRVECFAWFNLAWIACTHGEHLTALTFARCALDRMLLQRAVRGHANVFSTFIADMRWRSSAIGKGIRYSCRSPRS